MAVSIGKERAGRTNRYAMMVAKGGHPSFQDTPSDVRLRFAQAAIDHPPDMIDPFKTILSMGDEDLSRIRRRPSCFHDLNLSPSCCALLPES